MVSAVWQPCTSLGQTGASPSGQFQLVRSVDVRARVAESEAPSIYLGPAAKPRAGLISWLYKAKGRSYLAKCVPSPGWIQRGNSLAIAYNGVQYEFFDMDAGNLGYRRHDMWATNTLSPNPFFYPVEFLDPTNQQHPGRDVKLWYAKSQAVMRQVIAATTWERHAPDGTSAIADIPGKGKWSGHRFFYRVLFGRKVDYLPATIELVYGKAREISWRYDILAYRKTAVEKKDFYYAKSVLVRGYLRGKQYLTQRVDVQSCRLNLPLPASDFTIDFGLADRVFNIATGKIIYDRFASPKEHKLVIGVKRFNAPPPGKPITKLSEHILSRSAAGSRSSAPLAGVPVLRGVSRKQALVLVVVFAVLASASGGLVLIFWRRMRNRLR